MTQTDEIKRFKDLHVPGDPVVLYNIWDAGSAQAVEKAGAKALATGSWSVAGAQGYGDGEKIPLKFLQMIAHRIVATTNLPVSIDFEGAYSSDPDNAAENVAKIIETGAVGINFEDQVVGGEGLHSIERQSDRIKAVRNASDVPFFINARTDLFLKSKPDVHASLVEEAISRGEAYAAAGADGFFIPGLVDTDMIGRICQSVPLPINVMKRGTLTVEAAANAGVARVSHGPGPFVQAMSSLTEAAET